MVGHLLIFPPQNHVRVYFQLPFKIRRAPTRDIDDVHRENEVLTRKVHTQEEDFKLQNETMMHELNEVRRSHTEVLFLLAEDLNRR